MQFISHSLDESEMQRMEVSCFDSYHEMQRMEVSCFDSYHEMQRMEVSCFDSYLESFLDVCRTEGGSRLQMHTLNGQDLNHSDKRALMVSTWMYFAALSKTNLSRKNLLPSPPRSLKPLSIAGIGAL
jgi:hypothetical protein